MSKNYSENRKQLVLDAMDGKEVDRVPSGFWFHFLPDEIHANAFKEPALNQQLLAGERKYISEFQPDFVKIMTDGFFPYNNDLLYTAKSAKELANIQPLADDDPWFTQQIAYAKEITSRYGQQVATFYNIFCAGTTLKFMQPGTLDSEDAFLAKLALEEKEDLKKAFEVISGDLAKLAKRLIKEAGVTGIYLSVQNLLGDGITEELYQEVLAPGEKARLQAANSVSDYNILHICGYAGHRNDLSWYKDYPVKTVNWAAVVEEVPLEEGRKLFPNSSVLGGFGNLAASVIYKGTKDEIQAETRRIIAKAGTKGVILGADCTVPRDTDWQHFAWVREAAAEI